MEKEVIKCPVNYTLSILGGKWKWAILWQISRQEVIRYGVLKDSLRSIAHKTLSQQLKELENSGLVHRKQYNQIPPKVEYSLTEKGKTLMPILESMAQWGSINMTK
ncbi:MAG: helix-turn-helix transcriptional regulator [Peptococcaceae bacterium]|nr:helix-turn-helix transcriptional regulator [Peptococcaceae bacterium]